LEAPASCASRRPDYSACQRLLGKVGLRVHQRNGRHGGVCTTKPCWTPRASV
jgi:hypothetical protein